MFSKNFLTICPACTTADRFPRIDLHTIVTCTKCYARFIAEENYVDIEFDDTYVSDHMVEEETALPFEALQEATITKDANKEASKNYDRRANFGKEQDTSVEWMLVSSRGLQEEIWPGNNEIDVFKDSTKVNSCGTREFSKDEPIRSNVSKAAAEASSRGLGLPNKKKTRADSKLKKRKHTQNSATWGIGLRKPFRERRQVKSYSPSRESGLMKRRKLRLQKENHMGKSLRVAGKTYRKKVVKNQEVERSPSHNSSDGDVYKGDTTNAETADKSSNLFSEKYSEELKNFIKSEIKRQVLEGLGEVSTKMIKEIEVVEVEQLLPQSGTIQDATVSETQKFTAQVKLVTTILFPISLKARDNSPMRSPVIPKSRESMENLLQCKEGIEDEVKVVEGPELEDAREPELNRDTKTELSGLMNNDKLSDYEALLEDGDVTVPDSEYYDFEFNRSEDRFAPQQIWASYDMGMMPRDYLQIKEVKNIKPFNVLVSILEPAWFSELGNPLSCGEFSPDNRIRKMNEINAFSHLMRWRSDENGMIHIYPGEKEVWALYKDRKEFNQEKKMSYGYDFVQIASIDANMTIDVIPLMNFKGSKTVFQRKERELFQIHKKDFDRFSHQVPTFEMIGHNGVEGCMELDPAAILFD